MMYQRTIVRTAAFSSALLLGSVNVSGASDRVPPTMQAIVNHSRTQELPSPPDVPELESRPGYKGPAASSSASSEEHDFTKSPYKVWKSKYNRRPVSEQLDIMRTQLMYWTNGFVLAIPQNTMLCCKPELPFMHYWEHVVEDEQLKRELFHYCRVGIIGLRSNVFGSNEDTNNERLRAKRAEAKKELIILQENEKWDSLKSKGKADLLSEIESCAEVRIMNGDISFHGCEEIDSDDSETTTQHKHLFQKWTEQLQFYEANSCWQCCMVTGDHIEDGYSRQDMKSNSNPRNMRKIEKSVAGAKPAQGIYERTKDYIKKFLKGFTSSATAPSGTDE